MVANLSHFLSSHDIFSSSVAYFSDSGNNPTFRADEMYEEKGAQ